MTRAGSQPQLGAFWFVWQRQKRFTTHENLPEVSVGDTMLISSRNG